MTGTAIYRLKPGSGVRAAPAPAVAAGVGYVEILRAGVCGTDIQIARGERPDAAMLLGHEAVGAVDGVPNRLVVFNPVDPANQDRILGHSYDGVFRPTFPLSDTQAVPELVSIPASLRPELAALCEPVATVLYGWELADDAVVPGRVGIWGAGPVGLIHTQVAISRGLSATLVHPDEKRITWAKSRLLGEEPVYSQPGSQIVEELDAAFVCTDRVGAPEALAEAIAALRSGGILLLVGGIPRGYRTPLLPDADLDSVRRMNVCGLEPHAIVPTRTAGGKAILVAGHRGSSRDQILAAHSFITREERFFERLITHVVDPDGAASLINARCAGRHRDDVGCEIVKVIITFSGPP